MDIVKAIEQAPRLRERLKNLTIDPAAETPILFAKVKLLWQCNLSCVFCERPAAREPMDYDGYIRLLDQLIGLGAEKVHLSGGEIFLHPRVMDILGHSCERGIQVNFTSNGTRISGDAARAVAGMGVHSVSISLDAAEPRLHDRLRGSRGAHRATLKALGHLLKHRKKTPRIRVNTVATRANADDLASLHRLLAGLGEGIIWKLIPVDSGDKRLRLTGEQIQRLKDESGEWHLLENRSLFIEGDSEKNISLGRYAGDYYRRRPCYMPWLHLFIDPSGFVYPCCMTRGKIPALGNVREEPLERIVTNDKFRDLRMSMAAGNIFEICGHCDDFIAENRMIYEMLRG